MINDLQERFKITNSSLITLALGVMAVGAIFIIKTVRPPLPTNDSERASLAAQASTLSAFDDVALQRSVAAKENAAKALWTADTFAALKSELPAKWTITEYGNQIGVGTVSRRFLLTRPDASVRDYAEIRGLISKLMLHNVSIQNLTIQTADHRKFTKIQLLLSLPFSKS
jgi:hypothetical protein